MKVIKGLYYGKNVFIRVESIVSLIKLLFVVILGVILIPKFTITQVNGFNVEYFYLPYGVFMFSLLAVSSIPIMNEHIKSKQTLKKSIIWKTKRLFYGYSMWQLKTNKIYTWKEVSFLVSSSSI